MSKSIRALVDQLFAGADAPPPAPAPAPAPRPAPSQAEAQVQVDAVVRAARATVAAAGNRAVGMVEAARQAGAAGHEALTQAMLEGLMDALARLAALESRKALTFAGAYDITKAYSPGDLTQRSGSLWLALVETTEAPGQSAHWREIAKCR